MSDVLWEDPEPSNAGRVRHSTVWRALAPLTEHPKRWAIVYQGRPDKVRQRAANWPRTTSKPPGQWEFTFRSCDDGTAKLYARYAEPITLKKGLTGAKPERFCRWVLDLLGYVEGDELIDLFPGTGIMDRVLAQGRLAV